MRKKLRNWDLSHKAIAKDLNIAKSTVTLVLKNFDERLSTERKVGSGRKKGFTSEKKAKEVLRTFQRNPGLSIRDAATCPHVAWICSNGMQRERSSIV